MTTQPSHHDVDKTFNIAIVGPSNSGKTVFLASMWYALQQASPLRDFYLETEPHNAKFLNQSFHTINSGGNWISSNAKDIVKEIQFAVRVRGDDGRVFTSCTFNYMDYAGGILTDPATGIIVDKVENKFRDADCFLALLDGYVLHQLVREPEGNVAGMFRDIDLPAILMPIGAALDGDVLRPVQFVISKWDHLQREGITLTQIRTSLMKIDKFADFVGITTQEGESASIDYSKKMRARFIPVSSVGFDFVESWRLVDSDPVMDIKKGAKVTPWNVEMPISCVLPDRLAALQECVKAKENEEQKKEFQSNLSWWQRIQVWAPEVLQSIIPPRWLENSLMKTIEFILEKNAKSIAEDEDARRDDFEQRKSEIIADLNDQIGAFELTLLSFSQLQQNLNTQFPESELG